MKKTKQLKKIEPSNIVTLEAGQAISPVQAALQSGADPDQLLKFMELQERFDGNEARKAFGLALAKFKADCPTIKKTESGHNCKFASIAAISSQIRKPLADNELSYTWRTDQEGNEISVTCIVAHSLGHTEQTTLSAEPDTSGSKNAIQAIGSAVKYLQRYTLESCLGLSSSLEGEDDGIATSAPRITEDQEMTLHAMLTEAEMDADKFERYASRTIGAAGFADIRADQYDYVVKLAKDAIKMKGDKDNADNS